MCSGPLYVAFWWAVCCVHIKQSLAKEIFHTSQNVSSIIWHTTKLDTIGSYDHTNRLRPRSQPSAFSKNQHHLRRQGGIPNIIHLFKPNEVWRCLFKCHHTSQSDLDKLNGSEHQNSPRYPVLCMAVFTHTQFKPVTQARLNPCTGREFILRRSRRCTYSSGILLVGTAFRKVKSLFVKILLGTKLVKRRILGAFRLCLKSPYSTPHSHSGYPRCNERRPIHSMLYRAHPDYMGYQWMIFPVNTSRTAVPNLQQVW